MPCRARGGQTDSKRTRFLAIWHRMSLSLSLSLARSFCVIHTNTHRHTQTKHKCTHSDVQVTHRHSIARLHAAVIIHTCVKASVFDISKEKISEAAIMANGVSSPRAFAIPMAIAVLPVPGCPASNTARPAILPSLIMFKITPAACACVYGAVVQEPVSMYVCTRNSSETSSEYMHASPLPHKAGSGLDTHLPCTCLANHALRHSPGLQGVIQTQAADVGMRPNSLHPRQIPYSTLYLHVRHDNRLSLNACATHTGW